MKLRRETPYRAQKRNRGYMKARWLWAVKWAYDTVVQWTRDLWAVIDYLANKAVWKSEEEAWAALNKYYDKTKGLDKVDEALVRKAYDVAGSDRAPIAIKRWEWEWAAATMIWWLKAAAAWSEATMANRWVKSLLKNPWKYTEAEKTAILNRMMNAPETNLQKIWRYTKPVSEKVLPKIWDTMNKVLPKVWDNINAWLERIWNTSVGKYLQKKQVQDAAKKLWLEMDAEAALNDVKTMSLEDMYKQWKSQQNW